MTYAPRGAPPGYPMAPPPSSQGGLPPGYPMGSPASSQGGPPSGHPMTPPPGSQGGLPPSARQATREDLIGQGPSSFSGPIEIEGNARICLILISAFCPVAGLVLFCNLRPRNESAACACLITSSISLGIIFLVALILGLTIG
jgi:hypothetical protein